MKMDCCDKTDIRHIDGVRTCINCGNVYGLCLVHEWVDYNPHNVQTKTVDNRTAYVKQRLCKLNLNANEMRKSMRLWKFVEGQLNEISFERFPKLDFSLLKF